MNRNESTKRFWSGLSAFLLLSFLILFVTNAIVPAAHGQSPVGVVSPTSPPTVNLGDVLVGSAPVITPVQVCETSGLVPLNVSGVVLAGSADYAWQWADDAQTLPRPIPAGTCATIKVIFTPNVNVGCEPFFQEASLSVMHNGDGGGGLVTTTTDFTAHVGGPDLLGSWVRFTSSIVPDGSGNRAVRGVVRMQNVGTFTVSTPFTISFYLSSDTLFDSGDAFLYSAPVSFVFAPNAVKNIAFNWTLDSSAAGQYIIAVVDSENVIDECSDSIPPPLAAPGLTPWPITGFDNNNVTIPATGLFRWNPLITVPSTNAVAIISGVGILGAWEPGIPVDTVVAPITPIAQPNYEGICGAGCTQNSPSIAKSSTNVVITYQDSWGIFRVAPDPPTHVGVYTFSTDGGKTFSPGTLLSDPNYNPDQILGPPALTANGVGTFWYAAEYVVSNTGECAIAVSNSANIGSTIVFDHPNLAVTSISDKFINPRITVDKRTGVLYLVYTRIVDGCGNLSVSGDAGVNTQIEIATSSDGGISFPGPLQASATLTGPDWVDGPDVAVGPPLSIQFGNESLIGVAWEQVAANVHTITGSTFLTPLSSQFGPIDIGPVDAPNTPLGYSMYTAVNPFPSFPTIAASPIADGSNSDWGELYVAWHSSFVTNPISGAFDPDDSDIFFSKTVDGGQTWFTPVRVNDDTVGSQAAQFFPTISVKTDDGLIKIAYYDRRELPDPPVLGPENPLTNVFVAESRDGGTTFEPNVKITRVADDWTTFSSDQDPNMGVRISSAADADHLYVAWSGPPLSGDPNDGPDVYTTYVQNIPETPTWTVNATSLDFGGVPYEDAKNPGNYFKTLPITVINTGTLPVTIPLGGISISGSQASDFTHTASLPVTIVSGSSLPFNITFNPISGAPVDRAATLTISADLPASPPSVAVSLKGKSLKNKKGKK